MRFLILSFAIVLASCASIHEPSVTAQGDRDYIWVDLESTQVFSSHQKEAGPFDFILTQQNGDVRRGTISFFGVSVDQDGEVWIRDLYIDMDEAADRAEEDLDPLFREHKHSLE